MWFSDIKLIFTESQKHSLIQIYCCFANIFNIVSFKRYIWIITCEVTCTIHLFPYKTAAKKISKGTLSFGWVQILPKITSFIIPRGPLVPIFGEIKGRSAYKYYDQYLLCGIAMRFLPPVTIRRKSSTFSVIQTGIAYPTSTFYNQSVLNDLILNRSIAVPLAWRRGQL